MDRIDKKAREELYTLQKRADLYAVEARQILAGDGGEHTRDGDNGRHLHAEEATARALLAIEARLAMATSLLLWMLEANYETN